LESSQFKHADRLERLILIMALAMHWRVRIGLEDTLQRPTPLEKKPNSKTTPYTTALKNFGAVGVGA
jgi:uncharacterized protein (DUF849 family)